MTTETAVPMKICRRCLVPKDLAQFRPRVAGSELRHSWCLSCHAKCERDRQARRRRGEVGRLAGELTRSKDLGEAERLCRVASASFGGTLGLAKALWQCHEHAKPGSPTAARILLAILRLQELAAPKRPDVTAMDNDELAEHLERLHRKVYGDGQVPARQNKLSGKTRRKKPERASKKRKRRPGKGLADVFVLSPRLQSISCPFLCGGSPALAM